MSTRDELAEAYANRILHTLETADARARSFKAGYDAHAEKVKGLVEALERMSAENAKLIAEKDAEIAVLNGQIEMLTQNWDDAGLEVARLNERHKNIVLANKEMSRHDHVTFGELYTLVERLASALEYQLTALRKICDGSMFTTESERATAEKKINEALKAYEEMRGQR